MLRECEGGIVMPNYEYECETCGGRFEVIQKFSDPILTICRLCKTGTVRKVLSPTSFVLKGNGWYATDYPSHNRKPENAGDAPSGDVKKTAAGCASGGTCSGTCPSKG